MGMDPEHIPTEELDLPVPAPPDESLTADLPLTVTAHREGDTVVLAVAGEIDHATGPDLLAELRRCLVDRPVVLVLDLTAVTFLGSTGLSVFVEASQSAGHTALRIVAEHQAVLLPIRLLGLDKYLALYASRADALAGTDGIEPG